MQVPNAKKAELVAQVASIRAGAGPHRAAPSGHGLRAAGTRGPLGQVKNGAAARGAANHAAAARGAGNNASAGEQQYSHMIMVSCISSAVAMCCDLAC